MADRITVDASKGLRKTRRAEKRIKEGEQSSVNSLASLGKTHAKAIAPHYSGKLSRLIKVFKGVDSQGPYADVVSQNPTANDGHPRNIANFNLVRWMHATNGRLRGRKHIKSGSPRYMYKTREWLKSRKGGVAKGHFNKISIR